MAFMTAKRPKESGGDGELLAARIERAEAFAEHAAAEEAWRTTHDPERMASHLDKLMASAAEYRARQRLAEADRRFRAADDLDKRRQQEIYEEDMRPLCREQIALLEQVEQIEMKKTPIYAKAAERGVRLSEGWMWQPVVPETPEAESLFRTWERWLRPQL